MIMISATGRLPAMAAPTAAPTMACSAIGVLRTRSCPYFVERPLVTLYTPPAGLGDVLAQQEDVAVEAHGQVERLVDGHPERDHPRLGTVLGVDVDSGHRVTSA